MRWRDGVPYRKFKGQTGKVYWVEMTMAEVAQRDLYWLIVALTPIVGIVLMAWAAGILK